MYIESETVELKQELTKNIKKEIVAFANSKGGTIYIGVNDDETIKGLKNIIQYWTLINRIFQVVIF